MIKQYYTAYKARTMCPVCSEEEEIFITNNGVFPISTKTCSNCTNTFPADEFICSFIELKSNSTVSSYTSINI